MNIFWRIKRSSVSFAENKGSDTSFKELMNKTPSEFVRTIRLEHAAKLLRSSKLTASEIMFQSGFSNKSYFYREFLKQYRLSEPIRKRRSRTFLEIFKAKKSLVVLDPMKKRYHEVMPFS